MVKGGASYNSERPFPPLASLSSFSTPLKKFRPSPLSSRFTGSHADQMAMDRSSCSLSELSAASHGDDAQIYPCSHSGAAASRHGGGASTAVNVRTAMNRTTDCVPDAVTEIAQTGARSEHAIACGRKRLQLHRLQVSGKVVIPESWGREKFLQEWVAFGAVEDALRPAGLMAARAELMSTCQRRGAKSICTDVEVN
ncbi:hypothetical protein KP509_13G050600 [Ceratopteris richardii]|uniref:Uncharacterized protein n=1 Tax=Ceratopteris richardii TaxID=49495 RepID=A0A8T2TFQ0_CERRI|nr:hypothetical protein KP509_13G050600 [Ceratopteris richardii]